MRQQAIFDQISFVQSPSIEVPLEHGPKEGRVPTLIYNPRTRVCCRACLTSCASLATLCSMQCACKRPMATQYRKTQTITTVLSTQVCGSATVSDEYCATGHHRGLSPWTRVCRSTRAPQVVASVRRYKAKQAATHGELVEKQHLTYLPVWGISSVHSISAPPSLASDGIV